MFLLIKDLKHVLSEVLPLIPLVLPELAQDEVTEVREVDQSVPENGKVVALAGLFLPQYLLGNIVGDIHDLLVSGVQSQSGQGPVEILGKDRSLPQARLQGLEHRRHIVQLLPGELVRVVGHVPVHPHRRGQGDVVEDERLVLGLEVVGHTGLTNSLELEV